MAWLSLTIITVIVTLFSYVLVERLPSFSHFQATWHNGRKFKGSMSRRVSGPADDQKSKSKAPSHRHDKVRAPFINVFMASLVGNHRKRLMTPAVCMSWKSIYQKSSAFNVRLKIADAS